MTKLMHHSKPPSRVLTAHQQMDEQDRIIKAVRGKLTLGDVKDDPRNRRFAVSRVDASKMAMVNFATPNPRQKFFNLQGLFVDPTNIQAVPGRGSTPSSLNGTFSFTTTTTSVTFTWSGLVIYRSDGSSTSIPNGSKVFSGLTANTPYWFCPYYAELDGSVNWAGGASTTQSITNSQTMNLQYNVPLSSGSIKVTTPSTGTGGGTGGGGLNGCFHPDQPVWTQEGMKKASEVKEGNKLLTPAGWEPVFHVEHQPWSQWHTVLLDDGQEVTCTPSQPFYEPNLVPVHADQLEPDTQIMAQYRDLKVRALRRFTQDSYKVMISIGRPHLFYLYEGGPLVHNSTQKP